MTWLAETPERFMVVPAMATPPPVTLMSTIEVDGAEILMVLESNCVLVISKTLREEFVPVRFRMEVVLL